MATRFSPLRNLRASETDAPALDRWLGGRLGPVATPPSGTNGSVSFDEDNSYVFTLADFGFSDVDGHAFAAVRITTRPAAGKLYFDADGEDGNPPVEVATGQLIAAADIANGQLTYIPAADAFGAAYSSFTFQVQDFNNELDPSANTLTINVDPVNDAPLFAGFDASVLRVSLDALGQEGQARSAFGAISPDGAFVAFESQVGFVAGDTNSHLDIFIKNLATGAIQRVSTTSAGGQALGGDSDQVSFSPDGTKIVFRSAANNLVAADTNNAADIFVKDLVTGAIVRVSTDASGAQGSVGRLSFDPRFSSDGTKVIFSSTENFTGGADDGNVRIFMKDLVTGAIEQLNGFADMSPDGSLIVYQSAANNLVPGDLNNTIDIFVENLDTGVITRISTNSFGAEGNFPSSAPIFFANGTKVAFLSSASNLVAGDTNGTADIFVKDLVTGATTRISTDSLGGQLEIGVGQGFTISPDGTWLVFDAGSETYLKNLITGELRELDSMTGFSDWNSVARHAHFTPDGTSIVFWTDASNIVPGDNNTHPDVYVVSLNPPAIYEGGDPPLQVAPVVGAQDVDSANYAGGSLVVSITDGSMAGDQLSLATSSTPGSGVEVSGANISYNGTVVGTVAATSSSVTLSFNANATDAAVEAIAEAIRIASSLAIPVDGVRTVTFTLTDGGGTANGGENTTSFSRDILFNSGNDPAQAQPDLFAIDEDSTTSGSLFANNGSGPDSDPDGPPLAIAEVNGLAANVGTQIVLPSGALLTVNADGTFFYDANGAFDELPHFSTGAANSTGADSFTYTLAGGDTAIVDITISGLDSDDRIEGTAGEDILSSDNGADTLVGFDGDDFFFVKAGDLVIEAAGEGYDNVLARESYVLNAGAHVEVMSTDNHDGTAAINLTGNSLNQVIIGNAGRNILDGGGGADRLAGFGGDDFLIVDSMDDFVDEGAGGGYDNLLCRVDYVLTTAAEIEVISTDNHAGTAGIDITGSAFGQVIIGNAGSNVLIGGGGADRLAGLGGNDFLYVDSLDDFVDEAIGGGYDNLMCATSYTLFGDAEIEVMSTTNHAGTASINLTGSAYNQVIIGNAGNNILDGSFGADRLAGFGGVDSYKFSTNLGIFNVDTIDGFDADDFILLDNAIFTGLADGALPAGAFVTGSAAADADDRIIYNSATGALYFDADGNGAGAQIQFALLLGAPALTASDFTVI